MKKYIVNLDYDNNTHGTFESNNMREAIKAANEILRGSVPPGGNFRYDITETMSYGIIKSVRGFKSKKANFVYTWHE